MSGDVIRITEQDRGREVPVSAGQEVELRLPENPTTGFRWLLDSQSAVEVIEDRNEAPSGAAPGATSERVLRLRVPRGAVHVHLKRAQAWEPDSADATFDVILDVR